MSLILVAEMVFSPYNSEVVNLEHQASQCNDLRSDLIHTSSPRFQNQSLYRNVTVDIVFVGYDQEAVNVSTIDSMLQKDFELNYSDAIISYRFNTEYFFADGLYYLSLRSFVLQNSVNDTTSGLNETALQIQKDSGTRMSIYLNQSGRAINATAVEDWFAQNPYSTSQQAVCTLYVLNFTDLDSSDHALEHWYNVTVRNPDTNDFRDFWRAEWDNSLNPNVRFPFCGFSSKSRIFYVDPSAFTWYLSWARIWWGISVGGLKYDYYYNDLDSFLAIHDVNTPEGKSALAQYLAGWIDDLLTNLVSPKGLIQEESVPLVPLAKSMSMQILVLNNASQYGYTNERMSWIINQTHIERTFEDLLPYMDVEVSVRFADLMDYPAINTILNESIINVENGTTYYSMIDLWEDLINVREDYFNLTDAELVINTYVFLLNNVSMIYGGGIATGAAYNNQVLMFKPVELYFHLDGVTPKAGNTFGLIHECGHDLGFGHTFQKPRFAGDFVGDTMGYFSGFASFSKIRTDLLRRTIADMRLLNIMDKLVQDEYWYDQGSSSPEMDFLFDKIQEKIDEVNLSYDRLQYLESIYFLDEVEQLEDLLRSLIMPKPAWSWPMFQHDPDHSGYSTSPAPNTNNTLWNYTTDSHVWSSPSIAGNMVYVGSIDHNIYCLNASTGTLIWNFATGAGVESSPAFVDGRIYFGSYDDKVYCLNASNGKPLWNYTTGGEIWSSPTVVEDRLYVGSSDTYVYCLNASTGAYIWSYKTEGIVGSSPAVVENMVCIGSRDHNIYSINASSGALIWNYLTAGVVDSSPVIFNDRVYVGSYDKSLYCLNASTGTVVWNHPTNGPIYSSPAVAYGNVYFGSNDGRVYCLDASSGAHVWNISTDDYVFSSPAVADGKIYIGSYSGKVYCVDALIGEFIWTYTIDAAVGSCAVADGNVYVGSDDGNIYALGTQGNHDLTITNVTTSKTGGSIEAVGQNCACRINMMIQDIGDHDENQEIAVYVNTTRIATQIVTLMHNSLTTVSFNWDTTGYAIGNYTLWAYVQPVSDESYRLDNIFLDGSISVLLPGDVNGDGYVGIDDIFAMALHFGAETGQPSYDPVCDINDDNYIGIDDIFTAAQHFGEEYP
jgi:outer membrane protein assembly factor BamB